MRVASANHAPPARPRDRSGSRTQPSIFAAERQRTIDTEFLALSRHQGAHAFEGRK